MLKKIRTGLAILSFSFLTLLFLDFTGSIHHYLGWMAKIQLIPAILAFNIGVILFLMASTLLFGRVYCSVICPLGIWQDIISWFSGKNKKHRFNYSPAMHWLRYGFLILFVIALIAGLGSVAALLDPYGAYGRIASNLFVPIYQWGNNALAYFAERADSYAFYHIDVWVKSLSTIAIATLTIIIVGYLSWKHGRTYCNTICPVGTFLGLISRFSIFKPVFDTEKCNGCNLCARNCKASCIDTKNQTIDYSRCVTCMNCIEVCKKDAIQYRSVLGQAKPVSPVKVSAMVKDNETNARRQFLSVAALFALGGALKAQKKVVEGSLAVIEDKVKPERTTPVTPPGSVSPKNFTDNCVACGLCISVCPNNILSPSSDLLQFMKPEMSFERGFCRPECTKCSEVCPTSSVIPTTTAEKSATKIGYAVWLRDNCVVNTDDVDCGNCARHCSVKAIEMVPSQPDNEKSRKIPTVDTEKCIGCGACEYLCPSRPFSAIYVEGVENHRVI